MTEKKRDLLGCVIMSMCYIKSECEVDEMRNNVLNSLVSQTIDHIDYLVYNMIYGSYISLC